MNFDPILPRGLQHNQFTELMELYERNYILLRRLVPNIRELKAHYHSIVSEHPDLRLEIIEQCRYTTTVHLTHEFEELDGVAHEPDLMVRICYDSRTAEVYQQRAYDQMSLDEKLKLNRFLKNWLSLCIKEGHAFPISEKSSEIPE